MKIYPYKQKSLSGWGYWGDNGEIEVGLSSGHIDNPADFKGDRLDYHKEGVVYILTIAGSGVLRIGDQEVEHSQSTVVRINPGEVYCHIRADTTPLTWITFCTVKDPSDKVIV